MLLWEISLAGSGSEEVSEPRLIEQPESVTAIKAKVTGPRGHEREVRLERWETGPAISAKYSRALESHW
jgi:hypothetical protein